MDAMPGREPARLVYHPAGHDAELRAAVDDLCVGRWLSTRSLLDSTGRDWSRRSARTQVLGVVAPRSDALEHWADEDPGSPDLAVLRLRVEVERAVAAHAVGRRDAVELEQKARQSSWRAVEEQPADPVPWLCLLTLAALDPDQRRAEHRDPGPDMMLPPGPWGLFFEANRRDPFSREAHVRMLRYWLTVRRWSATDFVNFVMPNAPYGSPLFVLPLYLSVEQYRSDRRRDVARRQWLREPHRDRAMAAFESWTATDQPDQWPVVDLSHLAHALWAGIRMREAVEVFGALGSFASQAPWIHVADSPELAEGLLLTARHQAYVGSSSAQN
ncbi:hypothetical protein [Kitasatospora sp. NBC_00458]|uniref:hypothetical protein n=1 Tax=Kitasatospora sp. NBC_00458 TaxID=2903568 RepID=UPI002E175176